MSSVKCHVLCQMLLPQSNIISQTFQPWSKVKSSVKHVLSQMLCPESNAASSVKRYVLSQMLHRQSTLRPQSNVASSVKRYVLIQMLLRQSNFISSVRQDVYCTQA